MSIARSDENLPYQRGATRMRQMIDDLLTFTRTRLGDTLPVNLTSQDIGRICRDAADEVRASYPHARIELRLTVTCAAGGTAAARTAGGQSADERGPIWLGAGRH